MTILLHVTVSPRDNRLYGQRGAKQVIAQSVEAVGGLRIIERDLAITPLPRPGVGLVEASLTPDADCTATHCATLTLSETPIDEPGAVDAVLISTLVYNYAVFSALKAQIDPVVRPEHAFRRTSTGEVGILTGRSVLVVSTSDGNFDGAHAQTDFLTPYLWHAFAMVDIHQMEGIRLQNTARGADSAMQTFGSSRQELAARMLLMPLVA